MRLVFCLPVLAAGMVFADSEGWQNVDPSRKFPAPVKELWRAPLDRGIAAFDVEWRDGATGVVSVVKAGSRHVLKIAKRNAVGYVLVRAREPFAVPAGTKLRSCVGCEARNADCEYSYGFPKLYGGKEDLTYFSRLDTQGRGGPMMTQIANTAPGMPIRKITHFIADAVTGTNVMAAIVVAGAPSTSVWSEWTAEDYVAARDAWNEKVRNRKPPTSTVAQAEPTDAEFDALLAAEPDHTARVERKDGVARLLLDGKAVPPVFFKGSTGGGVKGFFGGAKLAEAGMDLQGTHVRFGVTKRQESGFWSKDGFDVTGAVAEVRKAMKRAPKAKFLLGVDLSAYPEFSDEHPDEIWLNDEMRKVFGHNVHSPYSLPKQMDPSRHWYWISNHSLVWREAVKRNLTVLIDELKRTGLSRRIVGIHLAGYHDAQFATAHPDYSKPAIAAFRRWLRTRYRDEAALRSAWLDGTVTFDTATPPVLKDAHAKHNYFIPGKDQPIIDSQAFLKKGPFFMQEDVSRHVKACFGKDIVTVRYCMGAISGCWCSAYDITPFAKSDTVDILCAQPSYGRRVPGFPVGNRLPLESFHRNGKLFLNEFDLRTYGAYTGWEGELAAIQYGRADDDAMWRSINRKLAGQMFAKHMGWWYLDMAGGWFEPDAIAADIGDTLATGRRLEALPRNPWHPDVAFVTDEDGALYRNIIRHYFNPDEQMMNGDQVQALAGSGVPCDNWLLEDWLEDPGLAKGYRTIVFWGLYDIDERRARLLKALEGEGRTLIFLAGTGYSRGIERIGFRIGEKPFPAQHETKAEAGVPWNMNSLLHSSKLTDLIGVKGGWPWQLQSPARLYLEESPDQKVMARFTEDGTVAIAERKDGGSKLVYIASYGGLTPDYFHHLAKESGAYVPVDGHGLEVDMNGDFISIHCLVPGEYVFRLPHPARVRNLKTGEAGSGMSGEIRMKLTAGETRWYGLER